MSVLGYGRKLIAYLFYYMAARLGACLFPTSINLTLRDNCFRKIFNAFWRENAKPLLFYCGTMPASLLVDQRQMIFFYNKTLRSTNIVLRVMSRLHLFEAQRLFSVYHVFPGHTGNVDIKRAVWSRFASVF